MSFAYIGVALATTLYTQDQAKSAQDKAKKQAEEDAQAAAEAETFAETEGQGIGELGNIELAVDDDLTEKEKLKQQGKSTISI